MTERLKLDIGSDLEIAQRVFASHCQVIGRGPHWWMVWNDQVGRWDNCNEVDYDAVRLAIHAFDGATYATASGRAGVVRLSAARIKSIRLLLNGLLPVVL
jgi:hypothetical protein